MISYRRDIDGLRAICIVAVLMFHAGFGDWTGGFIGVDVFFVISGYLITSLIAREISENRFSLLGFYERRVRRLLSATIPVILFVTLFAWAFYPAGTFLEYSKSLLAFVTYTSNWYFLNSTGYFGAAPETTPLLHTWSLAVEEQFYLVFPVLLLLLVRVKARVRTILAVIAVASFAYSVFELAAGNNERAFFSSASRFWELLAGALLALSPEVPGLARRFALPMRLAGLVMIIVPIFIYGSSTPFPGVAALAPVIGSLLVIAAGGGGTDPVARILSSEPMVYIGRISYSLYLWHWPVLAAMHTVAFNANDLHAAIALLISVALAALSYRYVEQPVRQRRVLARGRDMAGFLAAATAASVAIGAFGMASGGWPGRFSPSLEKVIADAAKRPPDPDACFDMGESPASTPNTFCKIGLKPGGKVDLLLWGDSHAGSLIPVLRKYAEERGLSFAVAARGDCLPLVGTWRSKDSANRTCLKFNGEVAEFIRANQAAAVVIAARWSVYTSGAQWLLDEAHPQSNRGITKSVFEEAFRRTISELQPRKVAIVEQVPQNKSSLPSAYLVMTRLGLPVDSIAATREGHAKQQNFTSGVLDRLAEKFPIVRINPAAALCTHDRCTVESGGKLLYFDDDHLNLEGSMFLYPLFEEKLDAWLGTGKSAQAP